MLMGKCTPMCIYGLLELCKLLCHIPTTIKRTRSNLSWSQVCNISFFIIECQGCMNNTSNQMLLRKMVHVLRKYGLKYPSLQCSILINYIYTRNDISITHMALQNLTWLGTCQNNHHETYYVQMKIFTV